MNQVILASHGKLAQGMKDTLNMIVGNLETVQAFSSYRDEEKNIKESIEKAIKNNYGKNDIYILTDILGGSVNNDVMSLLKDYPKLHIIAGMNLPLVISIAISENISNKTLEQFIKESQQAIVDCNKLINKNLNKKEEEL
ncbi:PTS system, mannose-specific IIA component/PTS system, fructoselysine and glucoselysine-specific IIA component [Clostridium sp. USBA 49]|uniref:PTS sugar transporter subunit IIA n=1 Tax=Clostridium sp. USBA 49 TaxID=1881060 RepID=UPI0009996C8D|nr:PTS fructose transporter subunit IIA [Clostridium sp. USBA 49]SKA79032.1 PTS system, mannose-specific IIA component/PTS system, fructoselysine and glucoselysine-specific IIA component [Clostridium sp. USBA 49]